MAGQRIYIIGIGMGNSNNLTVEAREAVKRAELLIGAARLLEPYRGHKECLASYKTAEIVERLEQEQDRRIAVLMSGDSGFYSGTRELLEMLKARWGERLWQTVMVLPGISSLSYFCAKIGRSWEDAAIVNLHGAQENLWQTVLTHEKVFAITGGNAQTELAALAARGLGESVYGYVGENLSYEDNTVSRQCQEQTSEGQWEQYRQEQIYEGTVAQLAKRSYGTLAVLYLENRSPVGAQLVGLPDESFIRGSVPMTKAEVRAVVMSRLRIRETDIAYDIGAGTGSVSVEMALAARRGKVYAVETDEKAVKLCKLNSERFGLHNLEVIEGMAPEAFGELPKPDVAFIGGSKGRLEEIVEALLRKNPALRLVITAITVESMAKAIDLLEAEAFVDVEMIQIQVSRTKRAGKSHLLTAQNPIAILSARGEGAERI